MKIIISESQYERLFGELPLSLKRRITLSDLEFLDGELVYYIANTRPMDKFEDFLEHVINNLLYEFIMNIKSDEIDVDEDDEYIEGSRDKVMDIYWQLKPFLEKRYNDRIHKAWEKKKSLFL
jgi:hypothetical protein